LRSNKKRVNRGTKKVKRSKSRKNTKKKLRGGTGDQSGGLSLPERFKKTLRGRELKKKGVNKIKAIFFDIDGTLSDAKCKDRQVLFNWPDDDDDDDLSQFQELLKLLKELKDNKVKLFILTDCYAYDNICNGNYIGHNKEVVTRRADSQTYYVANRRADSQTYYAEILKLMDGIFTADKILRKKHSPKLDSEFWAFAKCLIMDTYFTKNFRTNEDSYEDSDKVKRNSICLIDDEKINADKAQEFGFSAFHNEDNTDPYFEGDEKAPEKLNNEGWNPDHPDAPHLPKKWQRDLSNKTETSNKIVGKALDMTNNVLKFLLRKKGDYTKKPHIFTQVKQNKQTEKEININIREMLAEHDRNPENQLYKSAALKEHIEKKIDEEKKRKIPYCPPYINVFDKKGEFIDLRTYEFKESDFYFKDEAFEASDFQVEEEFTPNNKLGITSPLFIEGVKIKRFVLEISTSVWDSEKQKYLEGDVWIGIREIDHPFKKKAPIHYFFQCEIDRAELIQEGIDELELRKIAIFYIKKKKKRYPRQLFSDFYAGLYFYMTEIVYKPFIKETGISDRILFLKPSVESEIEVQED
jgi:hypothetical protein